MQFLERVATIDDLAPSDAWHLARKSLDRIKAHVLPRMKQRFEKPAQFKAVRKALLKSLPSEPELAVMPKALRSHGITIYDVRTIPEASPADFLALVRGNEVRAGLRSWRPRRLRDRVPFAALLGNR